MSLVRNTYTIAKKDFKAYFKSPIAYVVMAMFLGVMGWMFNSILKIFILQSMQFQQMRPGQGPSFTDHLLKPIWGNMNVVLLFLIPFITMRLFAEERKNNTIELLFTAPIRLVEIILGKYLSAFGFVFVMLLGTLPYPITLGLAGDPDWAVIGMCYLGTLCMVGVYISVGILCSAVTENQIIAGVLNFGILLFLWIINWASYNAGPVMGEVLGYMSIIKHFEDFARGVFNTKDFVFYLSAIGTWLFLTYKTLESYTWRS